MYKFPLSLVLVLCAMLPAQEPPASLWEQVALKADGVNQWSARLAGSRVLMIDTNKNGLPDKVKLTSKSGGLLPLSGVLALGRELIEVRIEPGPRLSVRSYSGPTSSLRVQRKKLKVQGWLRLESDGNPACSILVTESSWRGEVPRGRYRIVDGQLKARGDVATVSGSNPVVVDGQDKTTFEWGGPVVGTFQDPLGSASQPIEFRGIAGEVYRNFNYLNESPSSSKMSRHTRAALFVVDAKGKRKRSLVGNCNT